MLNKPTIETYWSQSVAEVSQCLQSTVDGLSSTMAATRLVDYGPNLLQSKAEVTALGLFLNQFKSPIVLILLFATIVSAFLQDWADAAIILLIVLGSALLSFWQEYNANNAAQQLRAQISLKTEVLRDGQISAVPTEEIVPGDVVQLAAGSLIPADGLVIEAKDFFVNQAALTGETFPVEKTPGVADQGAGLAERSNSVFMGTNVRSGSAKVLIVQTGASTAFGAIAKKLTLRPAETEFERGIRQLGYLLSEIMLVLVLAIFAANVFFHKPVLDSLLFSMALAVGLTPQLLPAIININLSKGSQAMAASGVIVRRLESIENFGSMDILCTDKTGTVTQGIVQLDGALDSTGEPSVQVLLYAVLNAQLQTGLPNPLDEAIVSKGAEGVADYRKVDEIPYDFMRKRLSVIVQRGEQQVLISKGAMENILAVCTKVQIQDREEMLDATQQAALHNRFAQWSTQGYRVLGVATKVVAQKADELRQPYSSKDEHELTFVGFLIFFDPPKAGIGATIQALATLGVNLKIITGDNRLVARHTGQVIGLGEATVLTGAELDHLHDDALGHVVEKTTIFAEVDPNQKERIILALKKRGHVVGYMGDGINDAPSLHSADVGISVANAVDVAKQAADLVLLEQDLDVLRQGIVLGRKTFANTMKYIYMATSANFGNMFSMAGASLFLPFLPMLPKQILSLNFLTDLPEMTIAGDNVDAVLLDRPHRLNIRFIRRFMLIFGPLSSLFDYLTFTLLYWLHNDQQALFQTGWFIESLISASLVVFILRTRLPFYRSRPSLAMSLVTLLVIGLTLALPYSPLAALLGFTPLPLLTLLLLAGIVLLYLLGTEWMKQWFYQHVVAES